MSEDGLNATVVFQLGPLTVTNTVVATWAIMAVIVCAAWLLTRRLQVAPLAPQTVAEGIVGAIESAVKAVAPESAERLLPLVGTLWIYLAVSNLVGLIPEAFSPNHDLSATTALALLVFLAVHWFGIRTHGLRGYLRHYLTPTPFLLPFHILGEITRTVALAVRLFGNIMSLEIAALMVLVVAGFLAPIPILMLHIVEALVQAYIFGMLALIYLAGAMQSQQLSQPPKE